MKMTIRSEPETHSVTTIQADRRLRLLRALWLATFALMVLLFLAGIPAYYQQQVLAQFAITARDETDLDALTAELVDVVQETLQPKQVSIWLRESE